MARHSDPSAVTYYLTPSERIALESGDLHYRDHISVEASRLAERIRQPVSVCWARPGSNDVERCYFRFDAQGEPMKVDDQAGEDEPAPETETHMSEDAHEALGSLRRAAYADTIADNYQEIGHRAEQRRNVKDALAFLAGLETELPDRGFAPAKRREYEEKIALLRASMTGGTVPRPRRGFFTRKR